MSNVICYSQTANSVKLRMDLYITCINFTKIDNLGLKKFPTLSGIDWYQICHILQNLGKDRFFKTKFNIKFYLYQDFVIYDKLGINRFPSVGNFFRPILPELIKFEASYRHAKETHSQFDCNIYIIYMHYIFVFQLPASVENDDGDNIKQVIL
jgi:hypothetical protein